MRLTKSEFRDLCFNIFVKHGFSVEEAEVCTEEIVEAQCRGRLSHGAVLIPEVLEWKQEQNGEMEIVKDGPFYAYILGNNSMGPLVAKRAMDIAIDKAKEVGIGLVGVDNKFPFILAGYNPRRAALQGLIGINWSVAFAKVAPWGSADRIFGTNPIGVAIPTGQDPIVLDMAITKIAAAEIRRAKKLGLRLPEGVAMNTEGEITTDPEEALQGAMITFGEYKGSGIALIVEILGGAFVGAKVGKTKGRNRGMVFVALQPDLFISKEKFLNDVTQLVRDIKASKRRPGFQEVIVPGERGDRLMKRCEREGVEIEEKVYRDLVRLAS